MQNALIDFDASNEATQLKFILTQAELFEFTYVVKNGTITDENRQLLQQIGYEVRLQLDRHEGYISKAKDPKQEGFSSLGSQFENSFKMGRYKIVF